MPLAPGNDSLDPRCLAPAYAADRAYAELLRAHEDANFRGQPLLTEAGILYLRQRLLPEEGSRAARRERSASDRAVDGNGFLPWWDGEDRRLWLGGILLKEFRQPAPNQQILLDVFQEYGWARVHIDDPLPLTEGELEEDAKRRLHDTIKNLNRGLPAGTIRFRGDGTGQGLRWEYDRLPEAKGSPPVQGR
jgi:hypothetical protein